MSTTVQDVRLSDRIRREWYLMRFALAMEDYPRKESKTIQRDLRGDLDAAAADVGTAQALRDLGHPFVLAERYKDELARRVPRYGTGGAAAGVAVGLLVFLYLAYAIGALETLEALGGGSVTTYPFGAETRFTFTEAEISMGTSTSWQGVLFVTGVALTAFVLGSRLWRAIG